MNLLPIVLALPTVFLAKKLGNFRTLLLAMFLYGLGYVAMVGAASFIYAFIIFLAIGVGFGLFHPIGFSLISRWSNNEDIGRHTGNFTAWGDVGRLVVSGGVTFLIVALSWRTTAFIYGLLVLMFFAYMYFFHLRRGYLPQDDSLQLNKSQFGRLLDNFKFLLAISACFLDNLASSPLFIFLPFLLLSKNIQPTFLSSFASAFLLGNLLGKVVLGRWADKFGSPQVFIVTEIIMAGLIAALAFVSAIWLIVVISIILGIATRGTVPATRGMVYASVADSKNFETANSITEFGNTAAAALAPLILGLVSNKFGVANAFLLTAVFALLAVSPALVFTFITSPNPGA